MNPKQEDLFFYSCTALITVSATAFLLSLAFLFTRIALWT